MTSGSPLRIGPQNPIEDVCFYNMKKKSFLVDTILNVAYLIITIGCQYAVKEAGVIRNEFFIIGFGLATVFAINIYYNLHMFYKYRTLYLEACEKAIKYATPEKRTEAESPGNKSKRTLLSSKSGIRMRKLEPNPDDEFFMNVDRFKNPKPRPAYPYESIIKEIPCFKPPPPPPECITCKRVKDSKNEVTFSSDCSSTADTFADISKCLYEATSVFSLTPPTFILQLDSSALGPPLEDKDIPLPTLYPLFKRRKDKYPISNWEEAKELLHDYKIALRDQPVSYSFHRGQSEKYQHLLAVPINYRDFNDMYNRQSYQLSPIDDKNAMKDPYMLPISHEVWRKFKINPKRFVNWIANLRVWISKTILQNVVEEIGIVNTKLKAIVPAVSIGNVGLDDLISTSQNSMIASSVPSLSILLPYLQISTNQRYVVQRLRELAEGNTMSNFSWKSGGKNDDRAWEPHLPTDAELIMHLFVTYMDAWMPISLECPDRKPFSTNYFSKSPDTLPQSEIIIYQQSAYPPKYQLILDGEICSLPSGAYNMFFAILLFVYHVKTKHNGIVGRMYLGESGINLLWTVED